MMQRLFISSIFATVCFAVIVTLAEPTGPARTAGAVSQTIEPTDQVQILATVIGGFIHPGIGLTKEILENARAQVMAKREPWFSGFQKLAADPFSARLVSCRNQSKTDPSKPDLDAFDNKGVEGRLRQDADKALRQALMFYFTGDKAYRSNAMHIIRVWSQMNPAKFRAYSEVYIHCSYPVKDLITAAELMRYTSSPDPALAWSEKDTADFSQNFVVPAVHTFFNQNGWFMNQDGYALAAAMSGDIFTSDSASYAKRVEWFTVNRTAPNKGWNFSIQDLARLVTTNSITGAKVPPQVQLMEMGRDQAHAGDDLEIFNTIVRMMNAQGSKVDPVNGTLSTAANAVGPYEFLNDRILAAEDYFSRFMLGYGTPWIPVAYDIGRDGKTRGVYPRIADNYRGRIREHEFWDAYYYYTYRKGVNVAEQAPFYYEAFVKRIVSSDVEWVFIPKEASGEAAKVPPSVQEPDVVEIVQRSSCLSTNARAVQTGNESFLRVTPAGSIARIAFLSCDTTNKTIGLRVRTTGAATLEMKGFAQPWLLPNTHGEWRYVAYTMERLEHFENIVFADIQGAPGTTVDLSQLLRKQDAHTTPPAFKSGDKALQVVAFVGAPMTLDFSAKGSRVVYQSQDKPEGSTLNAQTGAFSWNAPKEGDYSFIVEAQAGDAVAAKSVGIFVTPDRASAIKTAAAGYDPGKAYVDASLKRYQAARAKADADVTMASVADFFADVMQLQQAANSLELLTPLLPDGSMDFPKIVAASNIGAAIGLLVDGNNDTFPVYLLATNLNYTFDFGAGYTFSATAFAMQGRLNFEDRIANTKFYGSNDGKNWTELTPQAIGAAKELTRVEVAANKKQSTFRYLRIQKSGGALFEPSELRIYGERHETSKSGP